MAPPSKWDLILDQKPVPIREHLMEEVSRLFADELQVWPPRIDDFDAQTAQKLVELLADSPNRPDPRLYAEAFTLARYELERDLEAFDDALRNGRWMQGGLTVKDRPMLLFLTRFLTEQLLGLAEHTEGRLKRPQLLDVLERTRRHFIARGALS